MPLNRVNSINTIPWSEQSLRQYETSSTARPLASSVMANRSQSHRRSIKMVIVPLHRSQSAIQSKVEPQERLSHRITRCIQRDSIDTSMLSVNYRHRVSDQV